MGAREHPPALPRSHKRREVAKSLSNLANVRRAMGAYDEAVTLFQRALTIFETALGPEHPDVAAILNNLANVHRAMGAYDEATNLYQRALVIFETALGPDHPHLAYSLVGLAEISLAQDRFTEAVDFAKRALEVRQSNELPKADLAKPRFLLARALAQSDESKGRAIALAEQARDDYRDAGPNHRADLDEVDEWLRKHEDMH